MSSFTHTHTKKNSFKHMGTCGRVNLCESASCLFLLVRFFSFSGENGDGFLGEVIVNANRCARVYVCACACVCVYVCVCVGGGRLVDKSS